MSNKSNMGSLTPSQSQRQPTFTRTIVRQPAQTGTPRIESRQASHLEEQPSTEATENMCKNLVSVHLAMSKGLDDFTGTATVPSPDPKTGSYIPTIIGKGIWNALVQEITADAPKLLKATFDEKVKIVRVFASRRGDIDPYYLRVIEWTRPRNAKLYEEYIEAHFSEIIRVCRVTHTMKVKDRNETREELQKVLDKIVENYEETMKQYQGQRRTKRM